MSLGCVAKQRTIDTEVIQEVFGDLDLRTMFSKEAVCPEIRGTEGIDAELLSNGTPRPPRRSWAMRFASALVVVAAVSCVIRLVKGACGEYSCLNEPSGS